ncbi:MAG TPA: hypothetical protein VM509_02785 [Planctomycetota bacterium]|nr:hypothetical protein [Planctomycetota bacterium]
MLYEPPRIELFSLPIPRKRSVEARCRSGPRVSLTVLHCVYLVLLNAIDRPAARLFRFFSIPDRKAVFSRGSR